MLVFVEQVKLLKPNKSKPYSRTACQKKTKMVKSNMPVSSNTLFGFKSIRRCTMFDFFFVFQWIFMFCDTFTWSQFYLRVYSSLSFRFLLNVFKKKKPVLIFFSKNFWVRNFRSRFKKKTFFLKKICVKNDFIIEFFSFSLLIYVLCVFLNKIVVVKKTPTLWHQCICVPYVNNTRCPKQNSWKTWWSWLHFYLRFISKSPWNK